MKKPLLYLLATACALPLLALAAAERPADFASQVPLAVTGDGPWYRLELPLALQSAAAQPDLADLRVYNAAGEALAYSVLRAPARRADTQVVTAVKWFPLYAAADAHEKAPAVRVQLNTSGSLVEVQPQEQLEAGEEVLRGWLLDTSAIKAPLLQLALDWSSEREGFQRFSIEASDDLKQWRPWGEGQVARLSFADERIEQHEVSLPGEPARYLRLLWLAPQSAPVLSSAQVLSSAGSDMPLSLAWSAPLQGSLQGAGRYVWELPGSLAVERLKLDITQPNSLAPVDVFGRTDSQAPWRPLESGLFYRLDLNGEAVVQDELAMPGDSLQQVMMQVDDRGGGLGEAIPALRVAVLPTQVVFLARGPAPYTLALGKPGLKSAQLPLAVLIPDARHLTALGQARPTGPAVVAAGVPVAPAGPDFKRLALWAVLVAGVLGLAYMAFTVRRGRAR